MNEIVQNSDMNVYPKEYKSGEPMISYKLTNEWIPSVMPFNVFMQYHLITVFPIVELPPDADMQETIDQLTELVKR
ncbi:MAG: hypothetical protein IJ716_03905 [Lachnospiraceae bacterium]|nr:hypothetical protein [Lachnospiraceae bacterium]